MNFDDFCEEIRALADKGTDEDTGVSLNEITKNNGLILKGLMIKKADSRLSPTVYLEQFYEQYKSGETTDKIARKIIKCIGAGCEPKINADIYTDYEAIKDRIIYKVVNYSMNTDLLKRIPHLKWNDLAVVFCCLMDEDCEGYATILVRNEHLKMWDKSDEDIYREAGINTPRLMNDELCTMDSIIRELIKSKRASAEDYPDHMSSDVCAYILSNRHRLFGATSMLYSAHIKEVADNYGSGLYILPSSIHEVILLPASKQCDTDYMRSMIKEINATQVDLEDRLSDNLYYYDRNTGEITIAV